VRDLEVPTSLITDFSKLLGLKINREKCTILVMEAETQFKSHPFTEKASERYLGVQLNAEGNFTLLPTTMDEIKAQMKHWKRFHLLLLEQISILRSYIRPKLTYLLSSQHQPNGEIVKSCKSI